jgi:electron transport complex protein RnfD
LVTGLILAFNLPSNLPWWIVVIGALVSIGVGKMTFGGLGNNPFNPALVGRVFLLISFPVQMTSWPLPLQSRWTNWLLGVKEVDVNGEIIKMVGDQRLDAITGATPLAILKEGLSKGEVMSSISDQIPSHMELFMGAMGGSLGEIAAFALLIGFIWMLFTKVITWHIPISIFATIGIFTGILWLINPEANADPLFHLLTGGVMLGAIFMATDYVTSPMHPKGMWVFGIGIGLITVIIRVWGAYPEGISFAILIMNAFVPLINRYMKPTRFGEEVKKNG